MPATSKSQQRFMALVRQYQKGKAKGVSPEVKKAAKTMSKTSVKHFAATKHAGLPKHVKQAAEQIAKDGNLEKLASVAGGMLRGLIEAGVDGNIGTSTLRELVYTGLGVEKSANGVMAKLPGGNDIGDPTQWGVAPGQKPGQPQQGTPGAGQPGPQTPGGEEGAQPVDPNMKNQGGVAPLPHRYNFHMDAVVDRIKKDQVAYAQKKSREAQVAQHQSNVTPQAQQQSQQMAAGNAGAGQASPAK